MKVSGPGGDQPLGELAGDNAHLGFERSDSARREPTIHDLAKAGMIVSVEADERQWVVAGILARSASAAY